MSENLPSPSVVRSTFASCISASDAVLREAHVELDHVRAEPQRFPESGQRVLRVRGHAAAVRAKSARGHRRVGRPQVFRHREPGRE